MASTGNESHGEPHTKSVKPRLPSFFASSPSSANLGPPEPRKLPILPLQAIPGHALRVGLRAGLLGFCIRGGIGFLLRLVRVLRGKDTLRSAIVRTLTSHELKTFTVFFALFGSIWKSTNDVLRLVRGGVDDKLNGFVAGSLAGISLIVEDKGQRVMIAQQVLVRGLQCLFSSLKAKNIFHVPHGESLVFALASAQIMYAYALRPSALPKNFYKFILKSGPIPEPVLQALRTNIRNKPLDVEQIGKVVAQYGGSDAVVRQVVENMGSIPRAIPCTVLHPWTEKCLEQGAWTFKKAVKKIAPVYLVLNFVPMMILRSKDLLKRPGHLFQRASFSAFRSSLFFGVFVSGYQFLTCGERKLIKHRILSCDFNLAYWLIGLLASGSIFIEDQKRRVDLAMYVLPRGVDSLYRVLRRKAWVPRVQYFEVFMFSMGMGLLLAFFQTEPVAMRGMVYSVLRRANAAIEDRGRDHLRPVRQIKNSQIGSDEKSSVVKGPELGS
ncbi:hypothetical protein DFS34DRAFT_645797 [Phlyctochytrium arcticum]|nr:hypothetical protein DFS34DRAFT_645797 [Phlyctochytrium arcticum]